MAELWRRGSATVADVLTGINEGAAAPLAYTTVMTILARLFEKGYVSRTRDGRGYRYTAAVDEAALPSAAARRDVQQLVDRYGPATVAAFAADLAGADTGLIERLREVAEATESKERT